MSFFSVGFEIKAHVLELMPEVEGRVEIIRSIADTSQKAQNTPAIYLIPGSSNPSPGTGRRQSTLEVQRWTVVLAVRHAAAQTNIEPLLEQADELITRLINGLQGFKPESAALPLERVGGDRFGYSPSFCYFPLSFEAKFIPTT